MGLPTPRAWSNFASSFNHIGSAIITLMEVTSLNWIDTARVAMDARGVDLQRQRNAAPASAIFFILFVVVGAFFMVNLFVGACTAGRGLAPPSNGMRPLTRLLPVACD